MYFFFYPPKKATKSSPASQNKKQQLQTLSLTNAKAVMTVKLWFCYETCWDLLDMQMERDWFKQIWRYKFGSFFFVCLVLKSTACDLLPPYCKENLRADSHEIISLGYSLFCHNCNNCIIWSWGKLIKALWFVPSIQIDFVTLVYFVAQNESV